MDASPSTGLNAALAAELKGARAAAGLTFDQVAERSGISRSSVIRLEHAKRDITMLDFGRLCILYEVEPAEMIRRAQERLARK